MLGAFTICSLTPCCCQKIPCCGQVNRSAALAVALEMLFGNRNLSFKFHAAAPWHVFQAVPGACTVSAAYTSAIIRNAATLQAIESPNQESCRPSLRPLPGRPGMALQLAGPVSPENCLITGRTTIPSLALYQPCLLKHGWLKSKHSREFCVLPASHSTESLTSKHRDRACKWCYLRDAGGMPAEAPCGQALQVPEDPASPA